MDLIWEDADGWGIVWCYEERFGHSSKGVLFLSLLLLVLDSRPKGKAPDSYDLLCNVIQFKVKRGSPRHLIR